MESDYLYEVEKALRDVMDSIIEAQKNGSAGRIKISRVDTDLGRGNFELFLYQLKLDKLIIPATHSSAFSIRDSDGATALAQTIFRSAYSFSVLWRWKNSTVGTESAQEPLCRVSQYQVTRVVLFI